MDDTIYRQDAFDALNGCTEIFLNNLPPTIDRADAIEAIKALPSAQPDVPDTNVGGNLIDRQAALNSPVKMVSDGLEWVPVYHLRELPSAQPGWIPCTPETMPKMTDTYLVQVGINENGEGMHTEVRTADWNVVWHEWYVHTTRCFVGDIIKWMPIPWEGGRDEQN